MVFFAGNLGDLFKTQKLLIVRFPQGATSGINVGTDVRYAGAKIGTVSEVDVHEDRVEFQIQVDDEVAIKTDSKATMKSAGLLGGAKYLNISTGSPEAPLAEPGDAIVGEEGTAAEDVLNTVAQIAQNTQRITESIDRLLAGGEKPGELIITLYKTQRLLDEVNRTIANLNRVVAANEEHIESITGEVSKVTGQINGLLADNRGAIDTTLANVSVMTAQLPYVLSDVRTVLVGVKEISAQIKNGEGTAGRLLMDDEMLLHVQKLIDNTDSLLTHIRTKGIRVRIF